MPRLDFIALIVVAGACRRDPPPEPPAAPLPSTPAPPVAELLRFTDSYYRAILDDDSKRYHLPTETPEAIGAPLRHAVELDTPRPWKPGTVVETPHLRLVGKVVKQWAGSGSGSGFRYPHLVLSITNRSPVPIAYRVATEVDSLERCRGKGNLPHNALALAAGETVERTECIWPVGGPRIDMVEVVELDALEYRYVSRLDPSQVAGIEPRTAAGHLVEGEKSCPFIPWREIEAGGAHWLDVIDFYARHSCMEYSFYPAYRFRTEVGPLPAHEIKAAPSVAGGDGGS